MRSTKLAMLILIAGMLIGAGCSREEFIESYTILEGNHLSLGGVTMRTQTEQPKEILSSNHGFFYTEANNKSEWSIENKTIMGKLRAIENAPTMMGTAEAALEFFDYIEKQMDAINH